MRKLILSMSIAILFISPVLACPDDGMAMAHWANLRDDTGNIIGTVGCGSQVEVIGDCPGNPSRTVVYDPASGCYGTVADVYLYGGTCYEYEHPLDCGATYNYDYTGGYGNASCGDYGYGYGYSDYGCSDNTCGYCGASYGYCNCGGGYSDYSEGYCGYDGSYVYTERDVWAADDPVWLQEQEQEYGDYSYEEILDYEEIDYYEEDEDDCDWSWHDGGQCSTRIVVDISDQTVAVYVNGNEVLSGSCVTGMAGCRDTPCGEWTILDKQQGATLVGDDYSCDVDFWMPFTESGCGFHDATWRDGFGGDIYEYSGSHGCVNLEYGLAEQLYQYVDTGCSVCVQE